MLRVPNKSQKKLAKKQALAQREAAIEPSDELSMIISTVLASGKSIKAVQEFKNGKEKALHSMVGSVIAEIKRQQLSISVDAFAINRLIQSQIK